MGPRATTSARAIADAMAPPALKSTLDVSLHVTADALGVEYTFTNLAERAVCLWNRLAAPDPGGHERLDPSAAYVDLDGATLHVRKMVLPIPKGVRSWARKVPCLSRIEPGASFHEVVVLPLPVKVNHPYRKVLLRARAPAGPPITASRPAKASEVALSLGAFLLDEGDRLVEVAPRAFTIRPSGPAVARQVVLTETLAAPSAVPVLDYG